MRGLGMMKRLMHSADSTAQNIAIALVARGTAEGHLILILHEKA